MRSPFCSHASFRKSECGNAFGHELEVGEQRLPASCATLAPVCVFINVTCATARVDDVKGAGKTTSGWKIAGFIVLGITVIGVCVVVGYIVYSKSQQTSRKRFY